MDRNEMIERMKYLHNKKHVNYTYIAEYIGVSKQVLYKWQLPLDDKQHRNIKDEKLEILKLLINKLEEM
ncbi:hypothetical protein [Clostridium butyricum]|nr:MAG TPA: Regulatory protein [Caudoviricetes sp.]